MTGIAVGNCPRCGAAASYFARTCPHCHARNLPNPVAALAPSAAEPAGDTKADYGWLITAMAECEAEAKHEANAVRFLIVPVTATGMSLPGWSPGVIGSIGDAITLLHSTDALIGLQNRALALYPKPVTFALSDPTTKTVYKWKPAVGVSALASREIQAGSFTLGLDVPDVAKEIAWGPTIDLKKGSCYWINALVPAPGRSP
jgi:hypothetical protein